MWYSTLPWHLHSHISSIARSTTFHIRNVGKVKIYLPLNATEQRVHSVVVSKLDMWNSLLYGLPCTQIERLQRIQNYAACVIILTKKSCHITLILKELHWLPVSSRIKYKLQLFLYKLLTNNAPANIDDLLSSYNPPRKLQSYNSSLLIEPISNQSWGDQSFSHAAPCLCNKLPAL